ncbi:hypothetical protein AAG906_039101 [Vitis piasezkii]
MVENDETPLDLFLKIGLDERTARNTIANNKVTSNLTAVIHEAAVTDGCSRTIGNLLYTVATKFPANALVHRPTLLQYIVSLKIKTPAQLEAAFSFFTSTGSENFQLNDFEEACGVDFEENKSTILIGDLFGHVRKRQPWADPKIVKQLIDAKLYELLGARTAADDEKPSKRRRRSLLKIKLLLWRLLQHSQLKKNLIHFNIPQPEENFKVPNSLTFKSDRWKSFYTLPPEPNGYLHIGHAKLWPGKERGGCCYLRFDDTNPEAEKKEYIDHIEEIVQWMGWEPFKITYTSDYFQDLYDLAVELIRRAKLIRGMIEEGKATLRMKQDMQSDNFNMYDLIAYRIKFTPHPHAGDKWCVYPSYDYAHCIVDSLENITHSLCTLEFETRVLLTTGYYMCWVFTIPMWEYSRLNVTNTVMSKRKLNRLVTEKWVDGWDDPRLMTLAGLRRRGVASTSINTFIRGIGITRSDCSIIRLDRLEYYIREELNKTAPRTMVVQHPLKVVITNLEDGSITDLDAKKWPDAQEDDASAFHKVPFSKIVYIEQSDFRMKDSKDYYGTCSWKIRPTQVLVCIPIKCTEVILSDDKETFLHWVAEASPGLNPLTVEVRLFDKLFLSEWLYPVHIAVPSLKNAAVGDRFQFERLGLDSGKLVFNRTVTLRDNYGKGGK